MWLRVSRVDVCVQRSTHSHHSEATPLPMSSRIVGSRGGAIDRGLPRMPATLSPLASW